MQPAPGTWERYFEGDPDARNELVLAYWGLLQYVVSKVAKDMPMLERDELSSHGVLGLIDAISKFDPDKGVKFETYAVTRIRGAIIDELRVNDWVPRSVRSNARRLERARTELSFEQDEEPDIEQMAERANIDIETAVSTMQQVKQASFASLDEMLAVTEGENITLGETVEDITQDPEESYREHEVRNTLAEAMTGLDERDKAVVALHYFEGLTLSEIGGIIGVSESRVCQMHTNAVVGIHTQLVGAA